MAPLARPVAPLLEPKSAQAALQRLAQNLSLVVLGKPKQSQLALTCLVAQGHLLLEDVPGVGKTTLAEAIARSFGLSFGRIQFTADLLPADILGVQVFQSAKGTFDFKPGPIFHQLVLADELNRAPPRTQSALLEAMAQQQVTVDGVTHPLPQPFAVIATQNPADFSGTYPLPDSQLDRFLMRLSLGHPPAAIEAELLRTRGLGDPLRQLSACSGAEELSSLQALAARAKVDPSIADYVVRIAEATRGHPEIERGASTRAALAVMSAAKAHALWDARDFVTPLDVKTVLASVLAHRLVLRSATARTGGRDDAAALVDELVAKLAAPR